jgi:hypothetical protein
MKITLDISKLVEEGKLTSEEADKLTAHDTGSLGINILVGFAVVAIAAGVVALVPVPSTAIGFGLVLFVSSIAIALNREQHRRVDVGRRRNRIPCRLSCHYANCKGCSLPRSYHRSAQSFDDAGGIGSFGLSGRTYRL